MNLDIMKEATLQGVLEETRKVAAYTEMIANGWKSDDWAAVTAILKHGIGPAQFPVGTQFTTPHTVYGDIVWDAVAHNYNHRFEGDTAPSMTLLAHDMPVYPLVFDAAEALYHAEEELAAGTYHFTLMAGYDTTYGGGSTLQFTLTQPVPAGGVLMFPWSSLKQAVDTKISSYASRESTVAIESVAVAEGTEGTNLGVADGSTVSLNHTHRIRYGSNNYKESAARQFLNSDAPAGSVWTPQTKFDRPPSWATSYAGFMAGLPADFLFAVGDTLVKCKANNIFEAPDSTTQAGSLYEVTDKFWLASQMELFGSGVADGSVLFPYYDGAANADRIKRHQETARVWWTRTAYPGYANYEYLVGTSGALSGSNAVNGNGGVPACTIYGI